MTHRQRRDVVLAFTTRAGVDVHFMVAVIGAMRHLSSPLVDRYLAHSTGALPAKARDAMTREFLQDGDEPWLLTVDADMSFAADAPAMLRAAADPIERPIVGAYFSHVSNDGKLMSEAYRWIDGKLRAWRPSTPDLHQVDAIGAGFVLIHRSVLEAIADAEAGNPLPWWQETVENGVALDHDITFCRRAAAAGFPTYLDSRVTCGHRKVFTTHPQTGPMWTPELDQGRPHATSAPDLWVPAAATSSPSGVPTLGVT